LPDFFYGFPSDYTTGRTVFASVFYCPRPLLDAYPIRYIAYVRQYNLYRQWHLPGFTKKYHTSFWKALR